MAVGIQAPLRREILILHFYAIWFEFKHLNILALKNYKSNIISREIISAVSLYLSCMLNRKLAKLFQGNLKAANCILLLYRTGQRGVGALKILV